MNMALSEALIPTRTVILRGDLGELRQWRERLAGNAGPGVLVLALDAAKRGLPAVLAKPVPATGVNAYLCRGVSCLEPVKELPSLRALLEEQAITGQTR